MGVGGLWVIGRAVVGGGFTEMKIWTFALISKRLRRIEIPSILKLLPKHQYYRPLKNRPNHQYYRPQKIEEIAEKKVVRNFLQKIKILFFFEFFSENVSKTLLRGRETTRKKYRVDFEKFFKNMIFFDFACPSTTIHPSI